MTLYTPSSPPSPVFPRPKRRNWKRRIALIVLVILLIAAYGVQHRASRGVSGVTAPSVPVTLAAAEIQNMPLTLSAVGTVVPYESVAVRSRIDSQIVEVRFRDGASVKKGDLLFVLDDKQLTAQMNQLAANVARDRAQLENTRRQYERAQGLANKGFATKATRDDTLAAYESQKAIVAASEAALSAVKVQLSYTRITAPISGRTGTINVTLGNTVKANDTTPLVTINQIRPIRVRAALPQTALESVRSAMRSGKVTVIATHSEGNATSETDPSILAHGTLDYIDNEVDKASGTFETRAVFENTDEKLWPGLFVTLVMTLGEETSALTIPEKAVQHGQAGDYVFVADGTKVHLRKIQVARLQSGLAVIANGLSAGENVITDGVLGLKDGSAYHLQETTNPSTPTPATEVQKSTS
jgi:multidrug efflux system membrane fusion protein